MHDLEKDFCVKIYYTMTAIKHKEFKSKCHLETFRITVDSFGTIRQILKISCSFISVLFVYFIKPNAVLMLWIQAIQCKRSFTFLSSAANGHLKISRTWTAEMEMDKLSRDYLMGDN